ncbi:hypothetical protein L1987_62733 [Smallanthus sonchifolius]|uniref:Uncharacterized protein n=1 Tax=Smallanthus sonchifolius TaxID=185202 RepID=A0ACB9CBA9_9ASTR|nr:hypothetical protein L1987_62733 [Smallanthus sonchifolius]
MTSSVSDSDYRILKIKNDGHLVVTRYTNNNWVTDFTTPVDSCQAPFRCGRLGLCSTDGCSCPQGFRIAPNTNSGCLLLDNSLSLPEPCGGNSENYIYVPIGTGLNYFSIDFINPVKTSVRLSTCEALCSANCSCLALFYGNRSGACYLIENQLGSLMSSSKNEEDDKLGFIKVISSSSNQDSASISDFPVIGMVLLPVSGVLLISLLAIWMSRRARNYNKMKSNSKKLVDYSSPDDFEMFFIAGLPVRFNHEDLVEATMNFSIPIGSGKKNCGQAPILGSENSTTSPQGQSSSLSGSTNPPRARSFYFPLQALEMHEEGRYLDLVEPRLAGRVTKDKAEKLVKVALCCLHEYPSLRPTMTNVVAMLEGTLPVGEPRLESLNFLRFYGRRFTEPSMVVTGAEVETLSGFMVSTTIENSTTSAAPDMFSYMSSQDVSGPR